jgi:hypothetical protein
LWPSSIEAGNPFNSDVVRPFPTADNGAGKLFVYSPKEKAVFEVDKTAGVNRRITTAKIEFEGKEIPNQIDAGSDGLILSSEQNVMKLTYDGLLKYYKYYPAPRQPALVRALLMAQAVRAAYIGTVAGAYSAAFADVSTQTSDVAMKKVTQGAATAFGDLSKAGFSYSSRALKEFNARYKASQTTPNFVVMMTTNEKKGNQLIQVSKLNGDLQNSIDIKNDKEPEYDIDQIYNYLYYRPNSTEIVCYKL